MTKSMSCEICGDPIALGGAEETMCFYCGEAYTKGFEAARAADAEEARIDAMMHAHGMGQENGVSSCIQVLEAGCTSDRAAAKTLREHFAFSSLAASPAATPVTDNSRVLRALAQACTCGVIGVGAKHSATCPAFFAVSTEARTLPPDEQAMLDKLRMLARGAEARTGGECKRCGGCGHVIGQNGLREWGKPCPACGTREGA